jgi:aspartate carbamoyltransferase catalytic subunit
MKLDHVVSIKQFSDKALLDELFKSASEIQAMDPSQYPKPLQNRTLATIFYEPSTRTRLSFETAIQNLGANLISTENAGEFSSAIKGESLEDTIMTINAYADGIVIRHPEVGAAKRAAAVSKVPVINAGDGAGEHPTQALLDAYSIYKAKGKIDGLKIGLVGDLLNGRTVHSLMPLLSGFDVEFYLVSPPSLRMPEEYLKVLEEKNIKYTELDNWQDMLGQVDVLYMTRVQKERFANEADYIKVKDDFILTMEQVKQMKSDAIIMHPLPRVNEIDVAVDADPRAYYFEEVRNGLFMRMALLNYVYTSK